MGCGCRKNKASVAATLSSPSTGYLVLKNGVSTGRHFTSLVSAQNYAQRIDGEVTSV
jgi:hypothetical protein